MSYYIEREITPHGYLIESFFSIHNSLLERDIIEGIDCIPIAVFTAFILEAYLNYLGEQFLDNWEKEERKPWRNKVDLLHKVVKKSPAWESDSELIFMVEIFDLRNRFAHAKTDTNSIGPFPTSIEAANLWHKANEEPEWYRILDIAWVEKTKENLFNILEYFRALHGLPKNSYLMTEQTKVVEKNC